MFININSNTVFRWFNGSITPVISYKKDIPNKFFGLDSHSLLLQKALKNFMKTSQSISILMCGNKGLGKTTLFYSCCKPHLDKNLRLLDFCGDDYESLYNLYNSMYQYSSYNFIVFFNNPVFESNSFLYRSFQRAMDGGFEGVPKNVMFVAKSDMEPLSSENINNELSQLYQNFDEKLKFFMLTDSVYLQTVAFYMAESGLEIKDWESKSLKYSLDRGGNTPYHARQFVVYSQVMSEKL